MHSFLQVWNTSFIIYHILVYIGTYFKGFCFPPNMLDIKLYFPSCQSTLLHSAAWCWGGNYELQFSLACWLPFKIHQKEAEEMRDKRSGEWSRLLAVPVKSVPATALYFGSCSSQLCPLSVSMEWTERLRQRPKTQLQHAAHSESSGTGLNLHQLGAGPSLDSECWFPGAYLLSFSVFISETPPFVSPPTGVEAAFCSY